MNKANDILNTLYTMDEATSYSPAVKETLQRLEQFCQKETGRPNYWQVGNRAFFFEWPTFGETEDGSVEGVVYEKLGSTSTRIGTYMLDSEGQILEFPFLPEDVIEGINR